LLDKPYLHGICSQRQFSSPVLCYYTPEDLSISWWLCCSRERSEEPSRCYAFGAGGTHERRSPRRRGSAHPPLKPLVSYGERPRNTYKTKEAWARPRAGKGARRGACGSIASSPRHRHVGPSGPSSVAHTLPPRWPARTHARAGAAQPRSCHCSGPGQVDEPARIRSRPTPPALLHCSLCPRLELEKGTKGGVLHLQ